MRDQFVVLRVISWIVFTAPENRLIHEVTRSTTNKNRTVPITNAVSDLFESGPSRDRLHTDCNSFLPGHHYVLVWERIMPALQARRRMKNLLLFIPNMVVLCARLMTDSRVPATEKALVAGAVIYAIIPLDFIPDMIPFVGQIDDAYLIAITLLRLVDRTDARVVRQHWDGGGDVVDLMQAMAQMTAKLLPKRIRRVLTSRVDVAPEKEGVKGLPRPLLVVAAESEDQPRAGIN
jgi:uncharacterized membrane protein YkvA (DUF1232 family)